MPQNVQLEFLPMSVFWLFVPHGRCLRGFVFQGAVLGDMMQDLATSGFCFGDMMSGTNTVCVGFLESFLSPAVVLT